MTPQQLFRQECDLVERMLKRQGYVKTMFVIHCDAGIVPVLVQDGDHQQAYRLVGLLCTAYNATALVTMGEAWAAQDIGDGTRPALREDRREVVAVTMMARGPNGIERFQSIREMVRDRRGKAIGLRPDPALPTKEFDGGMYDLLPMGDVSPEHRDEARAKLKAAGLELPTPTMH